MSSSRLEYGLSQGQLAKAVFMDSTTISNYENQKRFPNIDSLEQIVNVFGYTLELNLIKKDSFKKDNTFYKEKNLDEILNMSYEDIADFIYVTQTDDVIANICKLDIDIVPIIRLENLKELILKRITDIDKAIIFFKIKMLYMNAEREAIDLIRYINGNLEGDALLKGKTISDVKYASLDIKYNYEYDCNHYYISNIQILDAEENIISSDYEDDILSDNYFDHELACYFFGEYAHENFEYHYVETGENIIKLQLKH